MMGGRKFFLAVVAAFSLLFMSLPVNAAYYLGEVGGDPDTNEYGITSGTDVILTYDVTAGTVSVEFKDTTAYFDQGDVRTDPITGLPIGPEMKEHAVSGMLTEIVFDTQQWEPDGDPAGSLSISEGGLGLSLDDLEYSLVGNGWGISGMLTYTEIPIPGAIWLLGSGLIGLAGLRRRFKNSE